MKPGILIVALLLAACSMERKNEIAEEEDDIVFNAVEDGLVYGILKDTRDDRFLIQTDAGDTLWVRMLIEGGFVGDAIPNSRFAYQPADSKDKASFAVNLSMLIGEWVEPSALAEGTFCGVELNDGGIAVSINSQTTEYLGWQLLNGHLLLMSTPLGLDINEISTDTFAIKMLTPDSLILGNSAINYYFCRQSSVGNDWRANPQSEGEEDMMADFDMFGTNDSPAVADSADLMNGGLMY